VSYLTSCKQALRSAAAALAWLILALHGSAAPAAGDGRVVAVADVHGAYDAFSAILREAGIIDASGRWVAGGTTFVQTGDILDRGRDVRKVLELLMALQ